MNRRLWLLTAALGASLLAALGAKPPAVLTLDQVGTPDIPGAWAPGLGTNDFAGRALAGVGDVNGDGATDFVIGAPQADPLGSNNGGQAYLIFGGRGRFGDGGYIDLSALDGFRGVRFDGSGDSARAGSAVGGVGDVNGDGFDDFLIGVPSTNSTTPRPGTAFLIYGTPSWSAAVTLDASNEAATRISGIADGDRGGASVSGAGDVNGDGFPDLLVGISQADLVGGANAGLVALLYGRPGSLEATVDLSQLNGTNGALLLGGALNDTAGASVSGAGDVNGDGYDDILVGAPAADTPAVDAGRTYLVYGSAAGVGTGGVLELETLTGSGNPHGLKINGVAGSDRAGSSVAAAGDVNGDGYSDILIGAAQADSGGLGNAGHGYLLFGSATGPAPGSSLNLADLDGISGIRFEGISAGDRTGESVAGLGDLTGDGLSEFLFGATMSDQSPPGTGRGYLVFGASGWLGAPGTFSLGLLNLLTGVRLDGTAIGSRAGAAVAAAGDVNGDAVNDLLISAYLGDVDGFSSAGQSYLLLGWLSTLQATAASFQHEGAAPRRWVGALGTGADPWGPGRAALAFDGGEGPTGGASRQTVTLHRTPPGGVWLPPGPASVHWEIATNRTGWASAEVALHYAALEFLGWDETTLTVFRAETPAGPWTPLPTTVDLRRNEVTATGVTALGAFAIGGQALTAERVIQHLLGVSPLLTGQEDTADINFDGRVDVADAVLLLNIGR